MEIQCLSFASTLIFVEKDRTDVAIDGPAKYIVGIVWNNVTFMALLNINTTKLPSPDADCQAHSDRVREHILGVIDSAGGSIGFAEYMHQALYAPGLGYYSAGATKFGEALTNPAFTVPTMGMAAVGAPTDERWKRVSLGIGAPAAVLLFTTL